VLAPESATPITLRPGGVQRFRVDMTDGQSTNIHQSGAHWEIARLLLDAVRPSRSEKPAPARDSMVRDWYIATSAWMQLNVHYDLNHVDRALALFPDDRDLLFLAGTHHAIYATPRMQSAVQSAVLPRGYTMDAKSVGEEFRLAKALLRRALTADPSFAEAHLRLGRVLALDGPIEDSVRELMVAERGATDDANRYYAALFLGAVEETVGRFDDARAAYERAAALFPLAQSPMLALAELARRLGDRSGALRAMQEVFALPPTGDYRKDPWWVYDIWQARDADDRLAAVERPFTAEVP
jgi:tetratricopeptide (TPR) repeat protein